MVGLPCMDCIYTIVGNVASGKSTVLPYVAEAVNGEAVEADSLFQTSDPFREAYFLDQQRWAFTNEIWLTVERVRMLNRARESNSQKNLVVDSGLFMSWVYAYSHLIRKSMNQQEWQLYTDFYHLATENLNQKAVVVYLDLPIPLLMQRIAQRGRDYELKYYTADYLKQLQQSIDRMLKWVGEKEIPIVRLVEADVPDWSMVGKETLNDSLASRLRTLMTG